MEIIKCKLCNLELKSEHALKLHISKKHKETTVAQYIVDTKYNGQWPLCNCGCQGKLNYINGHGFGKFLRGHLIPEKRSSGKMQKLIDEKYNGVHPLCACGCGEKLTYFPGKTGFKKYIVGHINKINNNWGHNKKAQQKSAETRRKRFKEGKIKVWNDGVKKGDGSKYGKIIEKATIKMNTKERAEKISKKLKGKKHTKEHIENHRKAVLKAWTPEMKQQQRLNTIKHLRTRLFNQPTDIEIIMADLLFSLTIEYEPQYSLGGYLFDFWIKDTNILIETDGNFWHCKSANPKYDVQKNKIRIDKQKNEWAKKNGYNLIRFWESDIKDNRLDVIQKLITEIKK